VAGGIDIDSGTGGIVADSTGSFTFTTTESSPTAMNFSANTGAGGYRLTTATGGITNQTSGLNQLTSAFAGAPAVSIDASDPVGSVQIDSGSGGILIGITSTCTPISLGDVVPTVNRTFTIAGGTIGGALTDTIDIGPDGVDTAGGATKVVNLLPGSTTLGTQTVNVGTGNRVSGTQITNVSTGTGTKIVNLGNADGLTTFNVDAITLINDSRNVATSINTGNSSGTVSIGNGVAGAINIHSGAEISIAATAESGFTTSVGDLTLQASTGSVVIASSEAVADAINIQASDLAGGITIAAGTAGILADTTGAISLDSATASNFSITGNFDLSLDSNGGSVVIASGEGVADALQLTNLNPAGGILATVGTGGFISTITDGVFTVTTGTGAISIGADAAAHAVTLGSTDTTSSTTIQSGTGDVIVTSTDAITLDAVG
ncbi:hypothetical protein LCGC14_2708560, partial [marine sediment metagenome]